MSAALRFVELWIAWYLLSVQTAMLVFLVLYQWRENRFGLRPRHRRYASFTDAALSGVEEAGWIMLRALVWPYIVYRALTHQAGDSTR